MTESGPYKNWQTKDGKAWAIVGPGLDGAICSDPIKNALNIAYEAGKEYMRNLMRETVKLTDARELLRDNNILVYPIPETVHSDSYCQVKHGHLGYYGSYKSFGKLSLENTGMTQEQVNAVHTVVEMAFTEFSGKEE